MGMNLDQILANISDGDRVNVTIVTNQDTGIAGYAVGFLIYHAEEGTPFIGTPYRPPTLATVEGHLLTLYLSDRKLDIDPTSPGGPPFDPSEGGGAPFASTGRQPFNANETEKLGVSISLAYGYHIVHLTFPTWGNTTASFAAEPRGNMLVGLGPPLGNSPNAVYVISFPTIPIPH